MMVLFNGHDLLEEIRNGYFDDHLMVLNDALADRHQAMGREAFRNVKVGDQMRFNGDAGKLAFVHVTVVEKHRTRVTVETEAGDQYVGNPSMLEVIPS